MKPVVQALKAAASAVEPRAQQTIAPTLDTLAEALDQVVEPVPDSAGELPDISSPPAEPTPEKTAELIGEVIELKRVVQPIAHIPGSNQLPATQVRAPEMPSAKPSLPAGTALIEDDFDSAVERRWAGASAAPPTSASDPLQADHLAAANWTTIAPSAQPAGRLVMEEGHPPQAAGSLGPAPFGAAQAGPPDAGRSFEPARSDVLDASRTIRPATR